MTSITRPAAALAAALGLATVLGAAAPASAAEGFSEGEREAIETIVREYLIENPEVLEEAFTALQAKREAAEAESRAAALADSRERLLHSEMQAVIGNPEGDVTVVEFFDYNCGYCRRAMTDIMELIEADGNVRVVFKEFPVLGQQSIEAAQVSIAVNEVAPEAYEEFHRRLMETDQPADAALALAVADEMGLPRAEIEETMTAPVVQATVEEVYDLANALGLTGTPSFVVGDQVIFGAVGVDTLKARVNEARCGAVTC